MQPSNFKARFSICTWSPGEYLRCAFPSTFVLLRHFLLEFLDGFLCFIKNNKEAFFSSSRAFKQDADAKVGKFRNNWQFIETELNGEAAGGLNESCERMRSRVNVLCAITPENSCLRCHNNRKKSSHSQLLWFRYVLFSCCRFISHSKWCCRRSFFSVRLNSMHKSCSDGRARLISEFLFVLCQSAFQVRVRLRKAKGTKKLLKFTRKSQFESRLGVREGSSSLNHWVCTSWELISD